jgi:hypothetical protein
MSPARVGANACGAAVMLERIATRRWRVLIGVVIGDRHGGTSIGRAVSTGSLPTAGIEI